MKNDAEVLALAENADEPYRVVYEGWRHRAERSWEKVRGLEPRLASVPVYHDAYPAALRLRAHWRIGMNRVRLAIEAIELLDTLRYFVPPGEALLLRAEAAFVAGDRVAAISSLLGLRRQLQLANRGRTLARFIQNMLRRFPPGEKITIAERRLRFRIQAALKTAES